MDKIYVLVLMGDPMNSSGPVILEIEGCSTNRKTLETLKIKKDKELDKYFMDHDDDDDYCYLNTDLSDRPTWEIHEYENLK